MFINNEEICNLKLIYNALITSGDYIVDKNCIETLENVIKRFEDYKNKRKSYSAKYMSEKRKQDKTYGQSYERKNKILGI